MMMINITEKDDVDDNIEWTRQMMETFDQEVGPELGRLHEEMREILLLYNEIAE